jgi:hypothetical protein
MTADRPPPSPAALPQASFRQRPESSFFVSGMHLDTGVRRYDGAGLGRAALTRRA